MPSLSPSSQGLVAARMVNINLQYTCNTNSVLVIFDSGASLAVTFDKGGFVGLIRPVTTTIGGLVMIFSLRASAHFI